MNNITIFSHFLGGGMLENKFQSKLIKDIKSMFPGCIVMKNDPDYIQGIPDLVILHNDKWVALECKRSENATHRPNQDFYVNKMNDMSYAAFVYPENRKEILDDISKTFGIERETCSTKSER